MYYNSDDISPPSSTTAATTSTPITAIHGDIIQSHILNRLDGPTLSSTSCASSQMLALCSDDHLWRDICNATWPSTTDSDVASAISAFPSGHRSFYSDAYPAIKPNYMPMAFKKPDTRSTTALELEDTSITTCEQLISAVDIFYDDELVYSKVLDTKTTSSWFLSTPFRIDLLTQKETVHIPMKIVDDDSSSNPDHHHHHHHHENNIINTNANRLRISWILIDPSKKRAINVASREALEARRHWLTSDVQFRYATVVMAGEQHPVQCAVLVTCGDAHVREVSLQVEDMEGKVLPGRDSLVILGRAMEGQRCKCDKSLEKDMYETFLNMRLNFREMKQRRERYLDMACVVTGILLFFAILVRLLWR